MRTNSESDSMFCFKCIPGALAGVIFLLCVAIASESQLHAQSTQNPSPMVEHVREHPRLTKLVQPGTRERLSLGTLFIPASFKPAGEQSPTPLILAFHCGDWIPELTAGQREINLPSVHFQLGAGSARYANPFIENDELLNTIVTDAEKKLNRPVSRLILVGWSAGYGAIREILRQPDRSTVVSHVLLIDGLHCSYVGGKPGPLKSDLETAPLEPFLKFARSAVENQTTFLYVHTEIFPGTFASTTETADWLIDQLKLKRQPVLKWGPMRTQQLGETIAGNLTIKAFAGNSAPDHVDLLHAMPDLMKDLLK